jgi:hypothetical protein
MLDADMVGDPPLDKSPEPILMNWLNQKESAITFTQHPELERQRRGLERIN